MNISESHGDTIQNIRIESGNHALVYSNSFLLPTKDEPVTINIDTKHGFSFSMIVDFETIPNGEQELIRSVEGNPIQPPVGPLIYHYKLLTPHEGFWRQRWRQSTRS